jgi:hypothetical protein
MSAVQLELFRARKPPKPRVPHCEPASDWGVWVNECGIFASNIGVGKWLYFQGRDRHDRLTMLSMGPGGGEWHVMCGTKEAAAEGLEIFIEQGIHKSHVKVARLSACQAKTEAWRARADAGLPRASTRRRVARTAETITEETGR